MMHNKFQVGDRVRLKSGGPVMTIERVEYDEMVKCVWFNKEGEHHSCQFYQATLKLVNDADNPFGEVCRESKTETTRC